jgi:hypothetical protein
VKADRIITALALAAMLAITSGCPSYGDQLTAACNRGRERERDDQRSDLSGVG